MSEQGIGASVRRVEDYRFITGQGRYTDDINLDNQRYAYIVRSTSAHATINSINTDAARAAAGVVAVFTGADMAADGVNGLPCGWQIHSKDGEAMKEPPHMPMVSDRVRHVGDQLAVVIADTLNHAREAAELIDVDLTDLPAVVGTAGALANDAPQVWDEAPGNLCYDWELGDKAAADDAFANAAHVTRLDLVNNRLVPNAMEPRAYIGSFDRGTGEYTLYTASQNPHVIRLLMGAFVLGLPEHKLRVVGPDVGGGFGSKIFHYAEEAIVTWAAGKLGGAIKWTAERSESFVTDAHGRDHVTHVELAMDADNNFLGLKVDTVANMGAYLSTFAPCVPTWLYGTLLAGTYKTPVVHVNVKAVFTNTVPVDAYRGAGRPEASYLIERVVNQAANERGVDPAELRRQNFIPKSAFPYDTPVALTYDIGDYETTLDAGLAAADYAGFEARRAEAAQRGMYRGIGISAYIEACGIAPSNVVGSLGARAGLFEAAQVRVNPTGSVSVHTGTHSHGQGHETTFAQVVSEQFGIPLENVEIVHGDTDRVLFGMGTYGSRSLSVGGTAIIKACNKIVDKAKKAAAHMMEAAEADVEFADGKFTVKGTDKEMGFGDVALAAYVPHNWPLDELEPGLDETAFYDPKNFTYPSGLHVIEVEIDPDTGVTRICNAVAADDFGRIVNPMIVEGQIHGGMVQGIGQALMENAVYDTETGQLTSGSYMDYCMPRADDLPHAVTSSTHVTLCTHNDLGVKGCGEAGAIGFPPAVMNAVINALRPLGVTTMDMPATPQRVWQTIAAHSNAQAAE